MAFSEKLREYLDEKKMKPVELARATGLSEAIISTYLSGKKEPKGKTCIAIANVLGVSLDELLESEWAQKTKTPPDVSGGARDAIIDDAEKLAQAFEERPALKELFDILIQLNDSNLRHFAAVLKDLRQL